MSHAIFGTIQPDDVQAELCFVLMPFAPEFNEVWMDVLQAAGDPLGLQVRRADDIHKPGAIMQNIWGNIIAARVLVAELTDKNANVFYELGLAHAIEKQVILLTQSYDDVPFDLKHLRVIRYENTREGLGKLATNLQTALREVLREPRGAVAAAFQTLGAEAAFKEFQTDHDLVSAPYLTSSFLSAYANGQPLDPKVTLRNIGKSAALTCFYCVRVTWEGAEVDIPHLREHVHRVYCYPQPSRYASPLVLAPNDVHEGSLLPPRTDWASGMAEMVLAGLPFRLGAVEAVVCQDQAGARYRFRTDQPTPDVWRLGEEKYGWQTWLESWSNA